MTDIVQQVLISVFTSTVIISLSVIIVRKYITKSIDHSFDIRLKSFERQLEQQEKSATFISEQQQGIIPEIVSVTYKLKVMLANGSKAPTPLDWDFKIKPLCYHLTEHLYKYRLFISEELFELLHEFKHLCQDAVVFLDVHTRAENRDNIELYNENLPDIIDKAIRAEEIYKEVVPKAKAVFDSEI